MRAKYIKTSLEIPVPINKPDLNGVVYTEKAIKDACDNAKDLPIILYDSDSKTKIKGIAEKVKYENGHILVDGYLFYGGTEESVIFDDENKIISMELKGFGISD